MSSRACYVEPSYAGEVRDVRDHKLINDDDEPLKVARHAIWQLPCRSIARTGTAGGEPDGIRYVRPSPGNSFLNADSYKYGQQAASQEQICCRSHDTISPSLKTHEYADVYIEHWRAVKIQFTRTYAYLVNFC